jgi:PAS domain S-box-containing protein
MVKQHRSADGTGRSSTLWGLPLSLGLYALCAASLAGACLYFFLAYVPGRRAAVINGWQQELALRADLRKATLDRWVAVGMADAETLASFPIPRALIASGAGAAATGRLAENVTRLREVVESFTRIRGYQRFVLLDFSLRIAIETGESRPLEPSILQAAAEVLARGKTAVNFRRHADGSVAVGFLARVGTTDAPRANDGGGLPSGGGVVLLETDPSQWLYPYLAMRPMAAASAETLLVKSDGDDVVFLSPLRHNPAPPLTFRRPANAAHFAATAALEARGEVDAFVDYRNEPVLAAVARLDSAPWGIVVKVDRREALATYQREIRQTGATAAFAFLGVWAAAFMLVFAWRWRAEAALREGEERYRATLYSIGDAVIATDQHGLVKQMNPVAARLTGWAEAEAQGRPLDEIFRIINEQTHAVVESPVARVLREGQVVGLANHTLLIGKDGNERPIADSGAPIRNEKGNTTGVVLVFRDQTEERAAQRSLQESERRYRTLAESLPHLVWTCRADGPCDYLSPRWVDYTGIPEADQLGYRWLEQLHPDDRERVIAEWGEVAPRGGVFDIEFRIRRADGAYRWFKTRAIPFRDDDGRVAKWFGSNTDIDDQKRMDEALRQSEEKYRGLFDNAGVGMYRSRLDGSGFVAINQRYADLVGFTKEELMHSPSTLLWADLSAREEMFRLLRERGELRDYEIEIVIKGGEVRTVLASIKLYPGEGYLEGSVVDVTERKRADKQIARLNSELEAKVIERTAELKDEMELIQKVISSSPVGVFACRASGPCVVANPAIAAISGTSVEKMLQLNFHELDSWKENGLFDKVQTALATGVDQRTEVHLTTTFGRDAWLNYSVTTFDRAGTPHFLMMVEDITDRKTKEEEIRLSRQRLDLHVKHTPLAVIEFTRDGRIARWNPAAAEIFGFTEEEAVGQHWTLIVPEEVWGQLDGVWEGLFSQSGGGRSTNLNRHKSGRTLHCEWFNTPLVAADGTAMGVASLVMDVTERNLVQEELARHRDHLQELVQARTAELQVSEARLIEAQRVGRLGNWEWDVVPDAISASEEFYRLFEVEPEQIARYQQFVECLHPDDRERVATEVNEALQQKRTYDTDYRVRLRDGRWRDIHARGELFTDADGKPVRLAGTCLDITERKQAEAAVRESEARYRATLYSIGDAVIATDAESRVIGMNPVAEHLTGWLEGEAQGKPLSEVFRIVNEETRAAVESPVTRVLREGQVVGLANHTLLVAKDGAERPIADSGAPIRDEKGETTGVVLVFRDQTEERRAGDALRRSEAILRAVIEGTTNLVCVKDQQGRIIIANSAMLRFIGKPESEIIGKSDLELVADAQQAAKILENDRCIMATGDSQTVEETGVGAAGRWDYLFTKSPYHNLDGQVIGVIGIGTDITERRRAEDEVRRLNTELEQRVRDRTAQLEESNKELEAFSYSVSHDLRAPLRAIDGFTRILADDYASHLDAEGKRLCAVVRENTKSMGQLIDDLLAFSRLGRAQMSLSGIDMGTMASSVFYELTTPESRARIDFQVGALPPAVADPTLMRQVWINLLSNAIKFSSKRERAVITVSAGQQPGECVYAVQDNGAGFDMQYVGKVFGVFQRLHSSKEFEGTGVGLALVQRVIRRHGGRVWAEGEPNKGATFYFVLQQRGA